MDNRRRETRIAGENRVTLGIIQQREAKILSEISFGRTKNLSLHGMNVVCSRTYPVDTRLKIILPINGNKIRILRIDGKVVWNIVEENEEQKETGLEFMDISPDQSLILIEYLFGRPGLNVKG
ncbi:MAG: PilZ domain-containing protein [Candidatus Aminicenantes bacterium]|nr:PilZ domain-containing protein [Candidatus Aminicenantes bacterium]